MKVIMKPKTVLEFAATHAARDVSRRTLLAEILKHSIARKTQALSQFADKEFGLSKACRRAIALIATPCPTIKFGKEHANPRAPSNEVPRHGQINLTTPVPLKHEPRTSVGQLREQQLLLAAEMFHALFV